tara:strand:- start:25 stop:255 length:231 start_codon:yes stop_codon:yes gene_type:complete
MTEELKTRPSGGLQKLHHWNSPKRQRTLSLTDEGWDTASELAIESNTNRSEVVEIVLRYIKEEKLDLIDIRKDILT